MRVWDRIQSDDIENHAVQPQHCSPEMVAYLFGGATGSRFYFYQPTPLDIWYVQHDLGRLPAVQVLNTEGKAVMAEVQHDSVNNLRVIFDVPQSGSAICT